MATTEPGRSLKIKFSAVTGTYTLAHPRATPGFNPEASTRITEITGIPEGVSDQAVIERWAQTCDLTWLGNRPGYPGRPGDGRRVFDFTELQPGQLIWT